jgi:hypothetical protein
MSLDVRVVRGRIDQEESPESKVFGEEVLTSSVLNRLVEGPPFVEIASIPGLLVGKVVG